jgi:putative MFS transporter
MLLRIPDDVGDGHISLLLAVALALLFEEYDLAMLTSALKHIAADLAIEERLLPDYLGYIRLGAVPAFALIPFADRIGRRRVFLVSLVSMGLLTFLTAFAQTATQFVVLQMFTRTFFVAGSAVAFVFVSEEFPAHRRGFGIGMLGALAATGHGLGAALFALIDHLPYGWRSLYAVGVIPVFLFPYFRRRIPETRRFLEHQQALRGDVGFFSWMVPLRELWSRSPARALGIGLAALLPSFGIICTFQFTGYFTQTVHGWSPGEYSLMVIVGGGIGIVGNVVAGRLGDRIGRRAIGAVLLASFPAFVAVFYRGPSWALPLAWVAFVFASQGGRVILRALATELFATAYRGAASGLFSILDVVGAAAGLFALGSALTDAGDLPRIIPWIATATIFGGVIVVLFPETKQKELEALAR